MAETVKGIKIEFEGSTVGLDNALKRINKESATTANKLKSIDKALKYNPHNVKLLTEKQKLLKERVEDTARSIKRLKAVQQQLDDKKVDKNSAEYRKLQKEIVIANSKLKNFTKQMVLFGNSKFNAVGGRIQAVGRKLTTVTRRARQVTAAFAGIALYKGFERLKTIDEVSTTLQHLGYSAGEVENQMEAAKKAVGGTRFELTKMSKVMQGALGAGVEDKYPLDEYLQRVADLAQLSGTDVQKMGALMNKAMSKGVVDAKLLNQMNANGIPIYKLLADQMGVTEDKLMSMVRNGEVGFDDLYQATEKYKGLAQTMGTETLSGAATVLSQQFGLMGADFLEGAYEPIKEGVEGIVAWLKKLRDDGTIKKWGTAVGEAIQYFVEWFKKGEASTEGMSGKGQKLVAAFGPVIKVIGTLVKMFMALPAPVKQAMAIFALIGGPLMVVMGSLIKFVGIIRNLWTVFTTLRTAFTGVQVAMTALTGPVGIALAVFAGLIAAGIAIYKNWDTIKAKAAAFKDTLIKIFNGIKIGVKLAFTAIKNAMLSPIRTAMALIKAIIDKIKGFFKFKITLPKMKLPHFSITPKGWKLGDLLKGKIPKLGIKWYAQGGIVDGAQLIGAGENGPEGIIPLSGRAMQPFADAIASNMNLDYNQLANAIVSALTGVDTTIVMNIDGKQVAQTTAPYMNSAINQLQARQSRKLGYVGV